MDKGENIRKLWKPSQTELFWHGTFCGMGRGDKINQYCLSRNINIWKSRPIFAVMPDDGSRRPCCPGSYVDASLNYTITDQLYPAPQKLTRFVRSEGFLLRGGTQPWVSPKSATHARIGGRGTLYTLYSCCSNLREAETQKSKFASRRSPLFRVRVPSPQNYAMVKRVSSNLVILVSLAQRQVFSSEGGSTQGPNSQHRAMMAWRPNLELFPKSFITLPPFLNPAKARRCFLYFLLLSIELVQWMMISLWNSLHLH